MYIMVFCIQNCQSNNFSENAPVIYRWVTVIVTSWHFVIFFFQKMRIQFQVVTHLSSLNKSFVSHVFCPVKCVKSDILQKHCSNTFWTPFPDNTSRRLGDMNKHTNLSFLLWVSSLALSVWIAHVFMCFSPWIDCVIFVESKIVSCSSLPVNRMSKTSQAFQWMLGIEWANYLMMLSIGLTFYLHGSTLV